MAPEGAAIDSLRIAIVVGHGSPIERVTEDELREIYLKRRRIWTSGKPVVPVNLPVDDALRTAFSLRVLGRRPDQLMTHWDRQYFDGITPPVVISTGDAVCEYVSAEPNAIAYIPAEDSSSNKRCRVILVLEATID